VDVYVFGQSTKCFKNPEIAGKDVYEIHLGREYGGDDAQRLIVRLKTVMGDAISIDSTIESFALPQVRIHVVKDDNFNPVKEVVKQIIDQLFPTVRSQT
jgi:hypothetical protein